MKKLSNLNLVSTIFLRLAVSVIGLGVLALCVLLLPLIWHDAYIEYPDAGAAIRVVIACMWLSAIPFYVGIYRGWRVLNRIDRGRVFAKPNVTDLRAIAVSAALISGVYAVSFPFFIIWAQHDDAPGLGLICLFFCGMSLIIAAAMELIARLLAEANNIKKENDMTV